MEQTIRVHLGANSYDIQIARGLLRRAGERILPVASGRRIHLLTDSHVGPLYADAVSASLRAEGFAVSVQILPAGEPTKRLESLSQVWTAMIAAGITRKDMLVALGGGVIGDLGGFAAATYLRGIPFVQIPTSLLAQVDSSVGGKVAIDLPEGKNLAGAFYQPKRVLIDPDALDTLPDALFNDGMGEVIKYGLTFSRPLFDLLKAAEGRDGLRPHLEQVICQCVDIKRQVVERDERDTGERMLLNFGHTLGHAIEAAQQFGGLSHGAAVGVGMHLITRLSESMSLTRPGTADVIQQILRAYHMPDNVSAALCEPMLRAISKDKKNLNATLNVILLREVGAGYIHGSTAAFFQDVRQYLAEE